MKFNGICPITNKVEAIYCKEVNYSTMDNPNCFMPGNMYACSAIKRGENLCEKCPINPLNKNKKMGKNP